MAPVPLGLAAGETVVPIIGGEEVFRAFYLRFRSAHILSGDSICWGQVRVSRQTAG